MAWIGAIGLTLAGLITPPPGPNSHRLLAFLGLYIMPFVFLALYVPRRVADVMGGIWIVAFIAFLLSPAL
jgi:hypothetical protein